MEDVIYLTGSSGFLGGMIVRVCEENPSIRKVYCPIREKYGMSGEERFTALFGRLKKCSYIDPGELVPSDTSLVVLSAFDVKFFSPVEETLKNSVQPIINRISECASAGPRIRGICIVSTAYVQPPLPIKRPNLDRLPFAMKDHMTASQLFDDLVSGVTTWKEIKHNYGSNLTEYHKTNCYAFSKHVMEHVVQERFPSLPICMLRPSMIAPSRSGEYGFQSRAGIPLFVSVSSTGLMRVPRNEGESNVVFVEDVARDALQCAALLAKPASTPDESGVRWHPIRMSTSTSVLTILDFFQATAPNTCRYNTSNRALRSALRFLEHTVVLAAKGRRARKYLGTLYKNYDLFFSNTWDFEAAYPPNAEEFLECCWRHIQKERPG